MALSFLVRSLESMEFNEKRVYGRISHNYQVREISHRPHDLDKHLFYRPLAC